MGKCLIYNTETHSRILRAFNVLVIGMLGVIWTFGSAKAAEIDSFTPRKEVLQGDVGSWRGKPMPSLHKELDEQLETVLQNSLRAANARPEGNCQGESAADRLYQIAREEIVSYRRFIGTQPSVQGEYLDSIYRHFTIFEVFSFASISRFKNTLARVFRYDFQAPTRVIPLLVGVDKIVHFYAGGMRLFKLQQQGPREFRLTYGQILGHNQSLEYGKWGIGSSGVFSYGDLVANFQGLRFWNTLLAAEPDIVTGQQVAPLLRCNSSLGKWERTETPATLAPYINPGWDEGINCSNYKTAKMWKRVQKEIKRLGLDGICQTAAPELREAEPQLGSATPFLLNTRGSKGLKD